MDGNTNVHDKVKSADQMIAEGIKAMADSDGAYAVAWAITQLAKEQGEMNARLEAISISLGTLARLAVDGKMISVKANGQSEGVSIVAQS